MTQHFEYGVSSVKDLRVLPGPKCVTSKKRLHDVMLNGETVRTSPRFWNSLHMRFGFTSNIFRYFRHDEVFERISLLSPNDRVRSMAEYVTLMNSSNLPELKPFIRTMVGLGIVVSFLVVLMNMHTMILERTREIGILKALGFSRFDIVKMLLGETAVLSIVGSLVGIAITLITQGVLKETNPGLSILLTPGWIAGSVGLALLGSAMGATVPALRASVIDPVEALRAD